jgi:hypothetical protein
MIYLDSKVVILLLNSLVLLLIINNSLLFVIVLFCSIKYKVFSTFNKGIHFIIAMPFHLSHSLVLRWLFVLIMTNIL